MLLNILIYFFSFPNWPAQKQFNGDTLPPLPCAVLTPPTAAPGKLATERAQLHGNGLIQHNLSVLSRVLLCRAGTRAASETELGLISLWGGSRLQLDAHMHKPQRRGAERPASSSCPNPSEAAPSRAPLNQIITGAAE